MIAAILEFSLRQRAVVLLGTVALLGVGLWSAFHLSIDAVPDITGIQVQINTEVSALAAEESEKLVTQPIELEMAGLPGVEEMRSITKFGLSQITLQFKDRTDIEVEKMFLKDFPEIIRVFSRIGTSAIASDPMPPNESDVYLFYKPIAEWPKSPGRPTTKAELREQVEAARKKINADYDFLFAQPIEMRFNEMLEGTKAELAVKICGNDYDLLEPLAEQIKGILEKTPGVAQVEYETEGRTPQLQMNIKREVLRRYNIQTREVNKAVHAALAGEIAGQLVEGNRRFDIMVRMPEELRADDEEIKKLPLRVGENGMLPLGQVVDFTTLKTVEPIQRESGQRRAALMVNLKTRDIEGYVRAAEKGIREQVKLPDGYIVEFGGQFQNLQEARARLAVVVPAALLLIFVLIFLAFGSLRQALLIYSGIPLAVTGGVLALWLRGMPFSITAAVGFIALATVVIGGIISSTFLTLVVLPVLYAWAERRSKNSSPGSPGTSIAAELPNP